jgi:hypothetical protein
MSVNIRGLQQYDPLKLGPSSMTILSFIVGWDGATHPFGGVFLALLGAVRFIGPQAKVAANESLGSLSHTEENTEHAPGCCVGCSVAE